MKKVIRTVGARVAVLCCLFAGSGVFAQELPGVEAPPAPVDFLPYGKEFLAPGFSNPIQQPVPVDGWELNTSTPLIFGHGIRLVDQRPGMKQPDHLRNVAFIYDIRQDEMRVVSGLPKQPYAVGFATWVGGDPSVYLTIALAGPETSEETRWETYVVRAASGLATKLNVRGIHAHDNLEFSERSEWILHTRGGDSTNPYTARLINLKGDVRELESILAPNSKVFLDDFKTGAGLIVVPEKKKSVEGVVYDIETLQPIKSEKWSPEVFVGSVDKTDSTDQTSAMLFRGQEKPSIAGLMTMADGSKKYLDLGFTNGGYGAVTRDAKYCVIEYNRALFLTEIVRVSKEQKEAIEMQAVIQKALQVGKMVGVAIHMFFADNDKMPSKEGFQSEVLPYIKSKDTLSQFVYTGPDDLDLNHAGNLDQIEVGFVPGPGGRAIVYGDGHVVWVPDK